MRRRPERSLWVEVDDGEGRACAKKRQAREVRRLAFNKNWASQWKEVLLLVYQLTA